MIEKLDKERTSSTYAIIDKINEIIDFLNDTYLMKEKDGQWVTWGSPTYVTSGVVEGHQIKLTNALGDCGAIYMSSDTKCPHCGESFYTEMRSWTTLAGYPPIYKDGVNINPDRNKSTTHCKCLKCNKEFDI